MKRKILRHTQDNILALSANVKHKFAQRHALHFYRANAVYTMIPKNACSTMRLTLALENGAIASHDEGKWIHANNDTFGADLHAIANADYAFVILRCPYRRLASAFLDKIVGKEVNAWALHRAAGRDYDPDALSFRSFVKLMSRPQLRACDVHWRPQSDFLVYREYDDWFSFERFDEIAPRLLDHGIALADARALTLHDSGRFVAENDPSLPDLPVREIAAMRAVGRSPGLTALYDERLTTQVERIFENDIEIYASRFGRERLAF